MPHSVHKQPIVKFAHKGILYRSRALIALVVWAPFVGFWLFSDDPKTHDFWRELPWDVTAYALFCLGGGIRWWATLYIGGRKGDELLQIGPYSVCRHPLYLGSVLIAFAVTLFFHSVVLTLGSVLAIAIYLALTIPAEESRLRQHFGSTYDDYSRRTPRFLPNWRQYQSPEKISVNVKGLVAELARTIRWLLVPIACEVLAHVRELDAWPRIFGGP